MDAENNQNFEIPTSERRLPGVMNILIGVGIGVILSLLCLSLLVAGLLVNSVGISSDCKTKNSSILDVIRVQTFAPGIFGRDVWSESYTSSPDRVTMTWLSNNLNAVAYVEYLVYSCGYTQKDVDTYFSEDNFKSTLFKDYQDVTKTAECSKDDLRHYEFRGKFSGIHYLMVYWVKPENGNRILDFMMAFPVEKQDELKKVATQLYPQLPACK